MNETRAYLQIQSGRFKSLEVQVGQMTKILLEEQKMSLHTLEEPRRVKVDAMELHEFVAKEKGSTSPEMREKRKKVKITPEMTL